MNTIIETAEPIVVEVRELLEVLETGTRAADERDTWADGYTAALAIIAATYLPTR